MTNLPEELFTVGNSSDKREYYFINLDGKEESVELDFGDRLSKIKCPLDGANLIIYNGDPHTVIECPACRKQLNINEELNLKYLNDSILLDAKSKISVLKEETKKLERIVELAENPNNSIKEANISNEIYSKYNQDNLSAKRGEDK